MTDIKAISLLFIIFTFVFTALVLEKHGNHYTYKTAVISEYYIQESKKKDKVITNKETKNVAASSYIVRGKKYNTLSSDSAKGFSQTGLASWYGPGFHGKKTANGEIYNQNALTAAHKTLPLSTLVKVTNLENMKSIIVRINDRGPYHGNRILDLSKKAAALLDIVEHGTGKIKLQVL